MSLMSQEEAIKRIYSVATRHYFAFGAKVSPQIAELLKALPNVCAVHPDEYVDIKEKRYPWDPFINGQALPYDGKYYPRFSDEELGMASQETLPNSSGEANNGLGDLMANKETLPNSYAEANDGHGDLMANKETLPNSYAEANDEQGVLMANKETLPDSHGWYVWRD